MPHNVVDRYVLLIHPLVLGSGRWLFENGGQYSTLRLVDTVSTSTGVVIATFETRRYVAPLKARADEMERTIETLRRALRLAERKVPGVLKG